MNNSEKAKKIIEKIPYITIATISEDGMPWNAPVFTAYDKNYTFYWGTYRDSQKSKNTRANKNVFLVIYDSTVGPGKGEGVYIKAIAEELNDSKEYRSRAQITMGSARCSILEIGAGTRQCTYPPLQSYAGKSLDEWGG